MSLRVFFTCMLVVMMTARVAAASMSTLQELPGVGLTVRGVTPEAESFGLSEAALRQEVERGLRVGRVPLLSPEAADAAPGSPMLELTIYLSPMRGGSHLFTLQVVLREVVNLDRPAGDLISVPAATWERVSHGIASAADRVLLNVDRLVRVFAEEYRSANPPGR